MSASHPSGAEDRAYHLSLLRRLATPVLAAGARRELRARLPVPPGREAPSHFGPAEAVSRTLAGIAPWLARDDGDAAEQALRATLREQARASILGFIDPASPDFVDHVPSHSHIDAAYLGQALLFAPAVLWEPFSAPDRERIAGWMRAAGRRHAAAFNNHLLFHALGETALARLTGDWDRVRVSWALRQHEQWYVGDGWYLDGPEFHLDYYNSFVIHPMLLEIAHHLGDEPDVRPLQLRPRLIRRAQRWTEFLERLVSPEATVPVFGRSVTYRCAIFTLPAYLALRGWLPESLSPGRVRAAVTAATRRIMESPGVFDADGWATIGFCGAQDDIAESYSAVSSVYQACNVLLPLGLAPDDPFWSAPGEDWTSRRAYAGGSVPRDASLAGDILTPHQLQWGV